MTKPYASAIIKLLQNRAIYDNNPYWQKILQYEIPIKEYFQVIGIDLDLNRSQGYARIMQKEIGEDDINQPIKLIKRNTLTYEQSLMAIILREWLEEFEVTSQQSRRLYVTKESVRSRIELFFKSQNNRKSLISKLDVLVEKMVDNSFLELIQKDETNPENSKYEVKTLLKVKISNEKLEEFKAQLQNYVESI